MSFAVVIGLMLPGSDRSSAQHKKGRREREKKSGPNRPDDYIVRLYGQSVPAILRTMQCCCTISLLAGSSNLYFYCLYLVLFCSGDISHERPSRHHERRWRGGSSSSGSRWPYNQKTGNDSASSSSSVPRAVATTVAGTTIVVGATGVAAATIPGTSTALLPVRGHEACLLPCHGPCAASNQASSCCKGFAGAASNGHHHHHHPPTISSPENNPHHRESHLILARKHLRVRTLFHAHACSYS
jgi:hypothetical protein